jgi:hypothetical protein
MPAPTRKETRRWVASIGILGDLSRARDRAAAAREAGTSKAGPINSDQGDYLKYLETAVSALDAAIGIAEKNLPKTKPVSEELSNGR